MFWIPRLAIFQDEFGINETYPEGQVMKMGKKAMQILSLKDEEFYEGMGLNFVELTTELGYGKTVAHLVRQPCFPFHFQGLFMFE